ncbi:MAG: DUF5723 family protein [Bacteroidales bacterium]
MTITFLGLQVSYSQIELSAFNATGGGYATTYLSDYQTLGVNPANLGWKRKDQTINFGLLEFCGSVYSESLKRNEIINDLFDSSLEFTLEDKQKAAELFISARLIGMISLTHLGASYQDEKIGGFGFNIRERIYWHSIFNENAASFLFLGYRDPYFDQKELNDEGDTIAAIATNMDFASGIYEGSDINFIHIREFNFGYGRELFMLDDGIVFYGGINLKYIQAYAGMQYYQFARGEAVGFSALSPAYDIDYDTYTPSAMDVNGLKKSGTGFGMDLGTTILFYEKTKIGLAFNDLGSINWEGNVYEGVDVRLFKMKTGGLDNYNIFEEGEVISVDEDPAGDDEWRGLPNKRLRLPASFRAGASHRFSEFIEVGTDLLFPVGDKVPGSFETPVFGLGVHYNPVRRVDLSIGVVTGGKFGTNVPFGISFFPVFNENASWEIGFAVRDISVLLINKNPTVSSCFGFLRFGFGK